MGFCFQFRFFFPPYATHEMSQGETEVPLSSDRCHRAGFPVYQCSARLGHGAALSALRGSARLLRPPSGSISTLISAEAALARHDHPSQTLEVRDCSPARASARASDSISPRRCAPFLPLTRRAAPCRAAPGRVCSLIVAFHLTPGEQSLL